MLGLGLHSHENHSCACDCWRTCKGPGSDWENISPGIARCAKSLGLENLSNNQPVITIDGCRLLGAHRFQLWWPDIFQLPALAAPLDVAWAWYAHSLAPSAYARDFLELTGLAAVSAGVSVPHRRNDEALAAVSH